MCTFHTEMSLEDYKKMAERWSFHVVSMLNLVFYWHDMWFFVAVFWVADHLGQKEVRGLATSDWELGCAVCVDFRKCCAL